MNESELPCGDSLCNGGELTRVFDERKNDSSSTRTATDTSGNGASGCDFADNLETNENEREEVEMCAGHSDSSSDAGEPMSTVELVEGVEEDARFRNVSDGVVLDGLLAESLAYDEQQLALEQTNDRMDKDNSDSSGMSSPDDLEELDEVQAAAGAPPPHISGDATLDFLDMDIDPRDLSASSSPAPPSTNLVSNF